MKRIEHAHLMDEATAKLIAENGVWLSAQAFPDELTDAFLPDSTERAKAMEVIAGTDSTYALARKYRIKTACDTDIPFSPRRAQRQGELLTKLVRWNSLAEALAMATGTSAQLLTLSEKRSPYTGKLGVVEEGALADLLLVDGNPSEDIKLMEDPGNRRPESTMPRASSGIEQCCAPRAVPRPRAPLAQGLACPAILAPLAGFDGAGGFATEAELALEQFLAYQGSCRTIARRNRCSPTIADRSNATGRGASANPKPLARLRSPR